MQHHAAVFLFAQLLFLSIPRSSAVRSHYDNAKSHVHEEEKSPRCCCSRAKPLAKYVCIDLQDTEKLVYSPASEALNGGESADSEIMDVNPVEILPDNLQRVTVSIPVKTRVTSQCKSETEVDAGPQAEIPPSSVDAIQILYEGKKWKDYSLGASKPEKYAYDEKTHIEIDGVVYAQSVTELATEKLAKCIQYEKSASLKLLDNLKGVRSSKSESVQCVNSDGKKPNEDAEYSGDCQKYTNTHACGWGEKKGELFKRVGRLGECLSGDALRTTQAYGFFGEESGKCPDDKYHRTSGTLDEARGLGWLFCDCKEDCE